MVVTAPAVALKVPVVLPAATMAEAGTLRTEGELLARNRLAPLPEAALESVIVQVAVADADTVEPPHCSDVIVSGASVTLSVID